MHLQTMMTLKQAHVVKLHLWYVFCLLLFASYHSPALSAGASCSQIVVWSTKIDELNDEEAELCDFLADNGHDMEKHFRDEMCNKVRKVARDPVQEAFRKTVDDKLDTMRPVKREGPSGVVSTRVQIGASGYVGHTDAEELADVDVLNEDASLGDGDAVPDQANVFDDDDDAKETETPGAVTGTGARWSNGFRYGGELTKVLKDYQMQCADFLLERISSDKGALVAHGMGLGKSLTTLAFLEAYTHRFPGTRAVVCCPKGMVSPWNDEIAQWTSVGCISLDVHPVMCSDDAIAMTLRLWNRHGGIVIIGHEQFKRAMTAALFTINGDTIVVVDEAHLLKTPTTQMYDTIDNLPTMKRVFLSGTPLQNNLKEYFTMVHLLQPGLLGANVGEFNRLYATNIEKGMQKDSSDESIAYSERCVQMLRWKVADVMHDRSAAVLLSSIEKTEFRVLHPSNPVVQDPSGSWITERHNVHEAARDHKVAVTVALIDAIRSNSDGDSIVVFSTRNDTLKAIQTQRDGGLYTGAVDKTERRDQIVADFNAALGCILYVATRAGGVGINLRHANRVIVVDASWNPADDAQAIARCYRMGQSKPVFVYRLIAEGTLEEGMYRLNVKKQNLTARILDEHEMLRIFNRDEVMEFIAEDSQESLELSDIATRDLALFAIAACADALSINPLHIKDHDALFSDDSAEMSTEQHAQAVNDMHAAARQGIRTIIDDDGCELELEIDDCVSGGKLVPAYPPVFERSDDCGVTFVRTVDFSSAQMYINLAPVSLAGVNIVHQVFWREANDDDGEWTHVQNFSAFVHADSKGGKIIRHKFDPLLDTGNYLFCVRLTTSEEDGAVGQWSAPSAPIKIA